MRQPRPENFAPHYKPPGKKPQPEVIDIAGATPLKSHSPTVFQQEQPQELDERATMASRHHDTMTPRHRDTTTPPSGDTLEAVRKAVREIGKEAATHRFTAEEKQAVAEIIFAYRQQGTKTSENEIARIALNYLVEEYRRNGDQSVLAQVLKKLNT